jgi:Virulence factor
MTVANLTILYWRDIPAQVIARSGRAQSKRELSARFLEAIDSAAMRSGAHGTEAYLNAWRRGSPEPCGEALDEVVAAAAARLEREYDEKRLALLVGNDGRET